MRRGNLGASHGGVELGVVLPVVLPPTQHPPPPPPFQSQHTKTERRETRDKGESERQGQESERDSALARSRLVNVASTGDDSKAPPERPICEAKKEFERMSERASDRERHRHAANSPDLEEQNSRLVSVDVGAVSGCRGCGKGGQRS